MINHPSPALIYHGGSARGGRGGFSSSPVSLDEKVKITANDTTKDFLNAKIPVSGRIEKNILSPGANEKLELSSGDHFTLVYTNPDTLSVGEFLFPPESYYDPWSGTSGYYSNSGFEIKKISVAVTSFQTTSPDSFNVRFREYVADGSKTAQFATGQGNLIGTVTTYLGNTSGFIRWYEGSYHDVDWPITAGYMLFCYIQSSDVDVLHGVAVWLHCYKIPI